MLVTFIIHVDCQSKIGPENYGSADHIFHGLLVWPGPFFHGILVHLWIFDPGHKLIMEITTVFSHLLEVSILNSLNRMHEYFSALYLICRVLED